MALDGVFLRQIRQELMPLIDGRVEKIYQPSKTEILLSVRTRSGAEKLLFNAGGSPRVHITSAEIENPKVPPMFCMLLRKHLSSGRLVDIRQDGCERILFFDFDSANEMGDICRFTLAAEIMGRYSNLILINSEGKIVDSIKRVGEETSSVRMVLPGMTYALPPKEPRLSLFDNNGAEIADQVKSFPKLRLSKALIKVIEGISPIFAREAEFFTAKQEISVSDMTDKHFQRLQFYLKKTAQELQNNQNKYTVLRTKEGNLKDFCFTDISQYGALMVKKYFDTPSEVLDYFYSQRDAESRLRQKAHDLFRLLINTTERISRRTENQRQELKDCENKETYKKYGDLIMSNLYRLEKGMSFAEVEDFYDENCPSVKIKLDKRYTPTQNAQIYYKKYRKADNAEKQLTQLIEKGEEELAYIDSVFDSLSRASTEAEIAEFRAELSEQGYIKRSRGKQKAPKALPPIKFISSEGFEILVGRNNRQNDKLTCKDSEKTDIWFHTKDIAGSHTIIKCHGETPSEQTILEAANIAAYHSKARNSSQVPVDYTLIRYVKKPVGAKPGKVFFTHNQTLFVSPDENLIEKLKA